jgi:hypothetical protein
MNSNYYIDNTNTNNKTSNPIITTMNNDTSISNELFLTQDPFAGYLFGAVSPDMSINPSTTTSTSVDEWLSDDFQHNGLLSSLMPDFLKKQDPMMDCYYEPSPALTSSSPSGSSAHGSPLSVSTPPATSVIAPPLFPDISPKKPGFRAIAPAAKKQPVPIMPKSAASPAPMLAHPPQLMGAMHPAMVSAPSNKRKHAAEEKESDEIAMKRQKNTDAARRSRLKKLVKMEALEARVVELESDNTKLSTRIAVLESEKSGLESKDKGLEDRIRTLEAQLAEAHKALTTRH